MPSQSAYIIGAISVVSGIIILILLGLLLWQILKSPSNPDNPVIIFSPGVPCLYSSFTDNKSTCYDGSVCFRKQINYVVYNNSDYDLLVLFTGLYGTTGCTGPTPFVSGNNSYIPANNTSTNVGGMQYLSSAPNSVIFFIQCSVAGASMGNITKYNINGTSTNSIFFPFDVVGTAKIVVNNDTGYTSVTPVTPVAIITYNT